MAIVLVTLGAAFGILSGRGAIIGMLSTTAITLITGLIGGSRYGVSSPTGPMTAVISGVIIADQALSNTHSTGPDVNTLVNLTLIFAALILFLLVLLRVHKLVKLIPNLVISGFVNGIALIIILSQFKFLSTNIDIALMFITCAVALLISHSTKNKEHPVITVIASSLSVIILMTLVSIPFAGALTYISIDQTLTEAFRINLPNFGALDFSTVAMIAPLALELALVGLLDTLLTSVIMDKKTPQQTQLGRELTGQSVAMFGAGLIGGIPGAQSTVPSMMLWQENGHHRYSKLILAGFCLFLTIVFAGLIQYVPLSVFGGIILKIAYDIADFTAIKTILTSSAKSKYIQLLIVVGTCVVTILVRLDLAVVIFTAIFLSWNKFLPKKFQITDLKQISESEGLIDEV